MYLFIPQSFINRQVVQFLWSLLQPAFAAYAPASFAPSSIPFKEGGILPGIPV